MVYLLLGLVLMPVLVLATLGGDVTWFAMFAGEVVVVALSFVVKKFSKDKKTIQNRTVNRKHESDHAKDDEFFNYSYSNIYSGLPHLSEDD
ncbi:hypothetical protein [Alteromonas gilva]|uniref:Uncharacterized protein n=1 Tax=Alteromonas gilva TaxID=2987522 RepID=A0ABT5L7B2_9ALTE|nr:hypothetical protein [Alteromonas gilva]MDC8832945.1 hypothetical protein [Alteromonas gilva]